MNVQALKKPSARKGRNGDEVDGLLEVSVTYLIKEVLVEPEARGNSNTNE